MGVDPRQSDADGQPEELVEDTPERLRRKLLGRLSRQFLVHAGTLLKQLKLHDATNQAVRKHLAEVDEDLEEMYVEEGSVSMVFAEGHTFVNGVWLRADNLVWENATLMTEGLERLNSRGMVIEDGLDARGLLGLATALRQGLDSPKPPPEGDAPPRLPGVRLIPLSSDKDRIRAGREAAREAAYQVLREGVLALSKDEITKLDLFMRRRQRVLVQRLVALAEDSPEELLALTSIRDPSLPDGMHSLMVCVFSIALGRLIGLSRRNLTRLGINALNHNLGEALLPEAAFNPKRELTSQERSVMERHPLVGMAHILHHYGFDIPMVERALASAEHHLSWDGSSGYAVAMPTSIHLFTRIIAIADVLNALMSDRPQRQGFPPDQAVKLLLRQASAKLDPVLTRTMVRLIGRYPPGSLVELDTGEWGLVLGPGKGATPLQRPRVLIISDEDGFELPQLFAVDLGERHPRRKAWQRTIVRTRDPKKLDLMVSAYLFADRIELEPEHLDRQ